LAKEPCAKVMVSLMDCKLHEDAIHRGPAQLYPAVREGIRGSMMTAGPLMLEPKQILRIEAPMEFMGEVSKLVNNKRGQLLEMNQEGHLSIITAKMPVAELLGWSSDLRSGTEGRGSSSIMDQVFERLNPDLAQKVIKQIHQRKGLSVDEMGVAKG
jgi:elongation factor 2